MASAAGLEPTTPGLGNRCSIQMSYADNLIPVYNLTGKKSSFFFYFSPALNAAKTVYISAINNLQGEKP